MAHISLGFVENFWEKTREHSWLSFKRTLEKYKENVEEEIGEDFLSMLIDITKEMDDAGETYPASSQELYGVLNQKLDEKTEKGPGDLGEEYLGY